MNDLQLILDSLTSKRLAPVCVLDAAGRTHIGKVEAIAKCGGDLWNVTIVGKSTADTCTCYCKLTP